MKSAEHEIYQALSNDSGYFEIQRNIISETPKAICFECTSKDVGTKPVWIPKSQTKEVSHPDFGRRIFIKNWLYSKIK